MSETDKEIYKQHWLGHATNVDKYGTVWAVDLTDGSHRQPEDVTKALKIIKGIGLDRGKDYKYVMVTIELVPDLDVKVNEVAIKCNKAMLDFVALKNK